MSFCVVCGLRRFQATRGKLAVGFHLFPVEPVQRQIWEDFCNSNGDAELDASDSAKRTICSDHFEDECFRGGGKRVWEPGKRLLLKDGAVPTLRKGASLNVLRRRLKKKERRSKKNLTTESQIQLVPIAEDPIKPEKVCRVCELEDTLHDLSLEENAEHARRFSSLTSIEIDETAPWLCSGCLGRLNDAYEFVQDCTEAENHRKSLLLNVQNLDVKQEEDEAPMIEFIDDSTEQAKEGKDVDSEEDYSSESEPEPEPKGSKVYTCETCQATFEKQMDLFVHFKAHGKSRFPCKLCDRSFARKATLVEHMYSHKIEPSFFCTHCSGAFKCRNSLQRHVKSAHLGLKPFSCDECGKHFAQKTHLLQHGEVHVTEATIPCELCSKLFKTDYGLRVHVRTKHRENQQRKTFECEVCSKQYSTKQILVAHRNSHREPNLLCSVCGNKYKTAPLLYAHMTTHNPKQTFACEQCPSTFKTIKSLKYHRLVHAGLKPFQCELCDRTFRCVTHLKTHQSVHTGAKPHECLVCHRRFAVKANMRLHMRVHLGERKEGDAVDESPEVEPVVA